MDAFASALGVHVERRSGQPRIYADANIRARFIAFMRRRRPWRYSHQDLVGTDNIAHCPVMRFVGRKT